MTAQHREGSLELGQLPVHGGGNTDLVLLADELPSRSSPLKKLLIADDEAAIRTLVRMTLDGPTCEIFEAGDGQEALKLVYEHRPALVLLDVSMPKMSGLEVCEAIKQDPELASTVVLMLTARAQEIDLTLAEEAGADGYFTKPFSPIALMKKVDAIFADPASSTPDHKTLSGTS